MLLHRSLLEGATEEADRRYRRGAERSRESDARCHPPPCPSPTWGEGTLGHGPSYRLRGDCWTVVLHQRAITLVYRAAVTATVPVAVRPKRSGRYMSST